MADKAEEKAKEKTSVKNVNVAHEGAQIILPVVNGKPMGFDEAIEWMKRKQKEEETKVAVHHVFECSPLDGMHAFNRALSEKYGWTQMVPTPGFFSDKPPVFIGVPTGIEDVAQVPFGRIMVPGIEGWLNVGVDCSEHPSFVLGGEVKQKHADQVKELVKLTNKYLKEHSIYKGKAIKVNFEWSDDFDSGCDSYDPIANAPKFMDLQGVKDDDLIFGKKVIDALNVGLFTPIEQSASCRKYKVPLKRGILLYGPYGTGKTMTANVSALKAVRNGWTFIYLDRVSDLKRGLQFAAKYAPAVIFAEDIDRVVTGNRSMDMDDILNTLDGVDTKGAEIITVLTTNHIEEINPAILRMGRLDVLVEVTAPDAAAVERLVRLYARGLLADGTDLAKIGKALEGQIPAFVREVTERAKISAIFRTGGGEIEGKVLEEDLLMAASAMAPHAAMLGPREDQKSRNAEILVRIPEAYPNARKMIAALEKVA